ncbi:hypothetical protein [Massilia glaciei]|uniref:Transmembrane protein n=1 Tax=Massilia glaciei TaxID=1524097 RepID=A0A2U2HK12_9BURK|nr:hypothetical protein [Massilia glaciei]PWF47756.1 hypothetical protein C7C56_013880 [Massilia glaciei]
MSAPRLSLAAALLAALLAAPAASAHERDRPERHQFGVIGHSFGADTGHARALARLKKSSAAMDEAALSFVVATGIKGNGEACSDELYLERRALFDAARRPTIVAPAASDWSDCKTPSGRKAATERLSRYREIFFNEPISLGKQPLALTRQSDNGKFRSYSENAHWIVGPVLYATVNLPANNNNFLNAAGRNSEFEDRMVANRFWLNRLFALARRSKFEAVVLFSEGDVKALEKISRLRALLTRAPTRQDGFAAPRRQIGVLAEKFKGKVLLVDTAALDKGAAPAIIWRDNLGHVSLGAQSVRVQVTPGSSTLFALKGARAEGGDLDETRKKKEK